MGRQQAVDRPINPLRCTRLCPPAAERQSRAGGLVNIIFKTTNGAQAGKRSIPAFLRARLSTCAIDPKRSLHSLPCPSVFQRILVNGAPRKGPSSKH
jgi:hypothetical protein